jgi:hypothetical protein
MYVSWTDAGCQKTFRLGNRTGLLENARSKNGPEKEREERAVQASTDAGAYIALSASCQQEYLQEYLLISLQRMAGMKQPLSNGKRLRVTYTRRF